MRVLAIVSTLKDYPKECIESILKQTISPTVVLVSAYPIASEMVPKDVCVVLHKPDMSLSTGVRVAQSLNAVLRKMDISSFDYILKSDSDVIFPPEFLEVNLAGKFDIMGRGCAMLIKVASFRKVMNGKFAEVNADDVYLMEAFSAYDYRVLPWKWIISPNIQREPRASPKRAIGVGEDCYRLGLLPFSILITAFIFSLKRNSGYLFLFFGYIMAAIKGVEKFSFADRVKQRELINLQNAIKKVIRA